MANTSRKAIQNAKPELTLDQQLKAAAEALNHATAMIEVADKNAEQKIADAKKQAEEIKQAARDNRDNAKLALRELGARKFGEVPSINAIAIPSSAGVYQLGRKRPELISHSITARSFMAPEAWAEVTIKRNPANENLPMLEGPLNTIHAIA